MKQQEIFETAVKGLYAQGRRSFDPAALYGDCLYRGPNGDKCAIGFLIPDKLYDISIEGLGADAPEVLECIDPEYGIQDEQDTPFLGHLQSKLHDTLDGQEDKFRETLVLRAIEFAQDYELDAGFITKLTLD